VVLRNSTDIFAGSDSKGNLLGGGSVTMCKVFRARNLFWSLAGVEGDYERAVTKAFQKRFSIRQGVERFSTIAIRPLQGGLTGFRRNSLAGYERFMQQDGGNLQFIFFGMEKKTPVVAM